MNLSKAYVIDTNVLLDDPNALFKLRNGNENHVFIPYHVLLELNKFKKDPRLGHTVAKVIAHLSENPDQFTILSAKEVAPPFAQQVDHHILEEIQASGIERPILVTNDKILQLQASLQGIHSENYKDSVPFKSEAEHVTGFVEHRDDAFANCFMWSDTGKPIFFSNHGEKVIDYQHKIWQVTPRSVEEKMGPYIRYVLDLLMKLHKMRSANRLFLNPEDHPPQFNPARFELLPLTYIRGMNIENAVVIVDEIQNMSRSECRALLSRMGEGVKCFCLGDTRQVDHPYLNAENNGLNWIVNKFKGNRAYAHLVLKGDKSRGPITDLVIQSGL